VAEGEGDLSFAAPHILANVFDTFGGAIEFIFTPRHSVGVGEDVGGLGQVGDYLLTHVWISLLALVLAVLIALPVGVYLGHRGSGELLAVAIGNAGRAVPELALIALMVAFIGVGVLNVTIALIILGLPPILTNAFVGIRQVDRTTVEAARGMGMTEFEVIRKVELPLAVPTIMGGVRTGAINIIATAAIAPLAGVLTLGDFIINRNVYGEEGVVAGAILVALLALAVELSLAGLQRVLTPAGVRSETPRSIFGWRFARRSIDAEA
jgi:osmoprotectant transport system permease protein